MRTIEAIQADMTALVEGANTAGRNLTPEECDRYEALEGELAAVRRSNEVLARQAVWTQPAAPTGMRPVGPGSVDDDRQNTYSRAFRNYLRTGIAPDELQPANAQSSGVPDEGGYLVPTTLRQKLVERLLSYGGLGTVVERFGTGTGNPVLWPTVDDTANEGEIVEENGTFTTGADVEFGQNGLTSYSYAAGGSGQAPIRVPWELIQDSAFDIEGMIARLIAERIRRIMAEHWVNGTGVKQPLGIVTGRTPVQTIGTTGLVYNDFVNWEHSVDPAYRPGARWVLSDATLKAAKKIVDSHGDPIFRGWGRDMAAGFNEATLFGYPLTIDQAFATPDFSSATSTFGVFGNLREAYVIRDVRDVQIVVNPWNRASYRQTEISAWARADGTQQNTNAYVVLAGGGGSD